MFRVDRQRRQDRNDRAAEVFAHMFLLRRVQMVMIVNRLIALLFLAVVVVVFITRFVPVEYVSKGAAVAFIAIGVLMLTRKL